MELSRRESVPQGAPKWRDVESRDGTWDLARQTLNRYHGYSDAWAPSWHETLLVVKPRAVAELPHRAAGFYRDAEYLGRILKVTDSIPAAMRPSEVRQALATGIGDGNDISPALRERVLRAVRSLSGKFALRTLLEADVECFRGYLELQVLDRGGFDKVAHVEFSRFGACVFFGNEEGDQLVDCVPRTSHIPKSCLTFALNHPGLHQRAHCLEQSLLRNVMDSLELACERQLQPIYEGWPISASELIDGMHADYVAAAASLAQSPWQLPRSAQDKATTTEQAVGSPVLPLLSSVEQKKIHQLVDGPWSMSADFELCNQEHDSEEFSLPPSYGADVQQEHRDAFEALREGMFVANALGYEAYQDTLTLCMVLRPSEYATELVPAIRERYGSIAVFGLLEILRILDGFQPRRCWVEDLYQCFSALPEEVRFAARRQIGPALALRVQSGDLSQLARDVQSIEHVRALHQWIGEMCKESHQPEPEGLLRDRDLLAPGIAKLLVDGVCDDWQLLEAQIAIWRGLHDKSFGSVLSAATSPEVGNDPLASHSADSSLLDDLERRDKEAHARGWGEAEEILGKFCIRELPKLCGPGSPLTQAWTRHRGDLPPSSKCYELGLWRIFSDFPAAHPVISKWLRDGVG